MNISAFKNKKAYGMFFIVIILVYSLFGITGDYNIDRSASSLQSKYCNRSSVVNVYELNYSENTIQSSPQTVLGRQVKMQKRNVGLSNYDFYVLSLLPIFFLVFLSFWNLYHFVRNCSYRFIIQFIHNKDGKKA